MKLEQSFEVAAPPERVWQTLIDVERVAPCLPGAAVTGRNDDGSYNGTFKVKIGPTSAAYSGKLEMRDLDEDGHSATMLAQGTDKRGQGGAKATIVSKLSPVGDATLVEVVTDYHITGRLARFGRGGMIEDISQRLLKEFAGCLQKSLAGSDEAPVAAAAAAGAASSEEGANGPGAAGAPAGAEASEAPSDGASETPSGGASETRSDGASETPSDGASETPSGASAAPRAAPAPIEASEPVQGLSLVASVLWGRVKQSPGVLAAVVGFLVALAILRRRN
jgi:carbon monoxide dehydrogenase subunit G